MREGEHVEKEERIERGRKEREKREERKKERREKERDLFGARGNSTPNLRQIRNWVKFLLSSTLFLV
ncbi:hypothetical protein GCM10010495_82210 [Kitasatospora herbaricolor]|nr:hypothetical protein GCM10010495_82210 [Kitasatospora herbaricolor]